MIHFDIKIVISINDHSLFLILKIIIIVVNTYNTWSIIQIKNNKYKIHTFLMYV